MGRRVAIASLLVGACAPSLPGPVAPELLVPVAAPASADPEPSDFARTPRTADELRAAAPAAEAQGILDVAADYLRRAGASPLEAARALARSGSIERAGRA